MRLNIAIPEENVSKPVLDAALESVTRLNEELLQSRQIPTFTDAVDGIRWRPEPPGGEHFDHAERVLKRGWGDCDDLAPYHAASLRAAGVDPGARAVVKRSGPKRWHAVVQRSDGSIEDPSIAAGMQAPEGVRAATVPTMASLAGTEVGGEGDLIAMPQLAVRPVFDGGHQLVGWDARVDIPWHHTPADFGRDVAMATLRRDAVADQAIVGALRGSVRVADLSGFAHEDVLDRADAMADALEGWDWEDVAEAYGEDQADAAFTSIGAFWDDLADVASKAVSFVPGVGPIASTAIDVAHGIARKVSEGDKKKARAKAKRRAAMRAMKAPRHAAAVEKPRGGIYPRAKMTPGGVLLTF